MVSDVNWADEMSTEFQTQSYSSKDTTMSAKIGSPAPRHMIAYKTSIVAIGVLGALTNGMVLFGFRLAGRSQMNSSSAHIANHTTLEQSTFSWRNLDLRIENIYRTVKCDEERSTCFFYLFATWSTHTTLKLWECVMLVMRFSMDAAGVFNYYEDSGPAGMAMCILVHGATLITIGAFGSIQCVVLHTLDCYWKIVHPVHHRKYYRRWMLHVGLLLPWLNGVAVNLLPAIGTSRIVNGICIPIAYWPVESMVKVRLSRFRTYFFTLSVLS